MSENSPFLWTQETTLYDVQKPAQVLFKTLRKTNPFMDSENSFFILLKNPCNGRLLWFWITGFDRFATLFFCFEHWVLWGYEY